MIRIWLNHWFSTAYNIIELIKENEKDFYIIGSSRNEKAVYKNVCDEWYVEPNLKGNEYVDYCLEFCVKHDIDLFIPRREMISLSKNKNLFLENNIKLMIEDFELMKILNDKSCAYECLNNDRSIPIPEYRIVTCVDDFIKAYTDLIKKYEKICFKFISDEGGKSYRLIDNSRKGYSSLLKRTSSRISYDHAIHILSEKKKFPPIMVMPYLPGNEISVDCLKTEDGIIMIPRIKNSSRIERIFYDKEILEMCNGIYKQFNIQYPCNIQFKYYDDIPYFLEINTRMSGGVQMACLASGINIPNIAVNQILGIKKKWKNNYEEHYVTHVEMPVII